jgi:uncharacterized protein
MAEQETVALIRRTYTAFSAGDIQTVLDNVSGNARWVNYGPETIPYAGDFTGRIQEFFQAIGESTTDGKVVPEKFIAQGDNVVCIARYTATVRDSGVRIDSPIAHFFTVNEGKITSWTGFSDSAAVAAAHTSGAAALRR